MEYTTLSNGVKAPLLGLGTFQLSLADTENAVYEGIRSGVRLIDTANGYLNETAVGRAVARAVDEGLVKREDLFISTKLWPTVYESESAVDDTLKRLQLDYVDLLFIHQPAGNFLAGYEKLEKAYREGKAKSLGISNFHDAKLENSWQRQPSSLMSSSWKPIRTTPIMLRWTASRNTARSSWAGIPWATATPACSVNRSS